MPRGAFEWCASTREDTLSGVLTISVGLSSEASEHGDAGGSKTAVFIMYAGGSPVTVNAKSVSYARVACAALNGETLRERLGDYCDSAGGVSILAKQNEFVIRGLTPQQSGVRAKFFRDSSEVLGLLIKA